MEFGPVPPEKFEEIIQHLRDHFPDEPLNVSVGLCRTGEPCELLEHHNLATLQEGFSVMAFDAKTGEVAGVALNGVCKLGDIEHELAEMETIDNIKYHRTFGLLFKVNKELDLFTKYNVDKVFELRILSVSSKFRGKGVAKQLFLRSEIIAEEHGFKIHTIKMGGMECKSYCVMFVKIIKVDATSCFTQRIAESVGLRSIKDVRYRDFKDEHGKTIYETEPPHDYYKVMVKELKQS